ncbi:nucleotidyltransferase family protein [Polynucleobacter nymphae]|uniref:nucleotidyltransferase family protein n=1 Tax=Polynucleobacter nymphae TaxID=2081043 RepID=UPI001C0C08CA|nr:nucleotidyltransferase family protein [Polynucleobacter nymphae]MBU3607810.1 nucleotidyltransferase family protein [Polynucleobacter nymphae]
MTTFSTGALENNGTPPIAALLLAAGYGMRLQPHTNEWPKCLMPVDGSPLLQYWLESAKELGASKVLVNLHHLATKVEAFLMRPCFRGWVDFVLESKLMGTAGTIRANYSYFANSTLLLVHADNYCQCDFAAFLRYHETERPKHCLITMMTFDTHNPSACGIVETDELGVVTAFYEKVANPPGNRANGAVYLLAPEALKWIKEHPEAQDFSTEVLPRFLGRIATWHNDQVHIDIGTIESLYEAQKSQDMKIPKRDVIEADDWEKMFTNHPIHQQLKSAFNSKIK